MNIKIERAESGFVVFEISTTGQMGKIWAFETAESLALWVAAWAGGE